MPKISTDSNLGLKFLYTNKSAIDLEEITLQLNNFKVELDSTLDDRVYQMLVNTITDKHLLLSQVTQ